MTAETIMAGETDVQTDHTKNRKRQSSGGAAKPGLAPQAKKCCQQAGDKAQPPLNKGWGPMFKDRDTFVDMHIC